MFLATSLQLQEVHSAGPKSCTARKKKRIHKVIASKHHVAGTQDVDCRVSWLNHPEGVSRQLPTCHQQKQLCRSIPALQTTWIHHKEMWMDLTLSRSTAFEQRLTDEEGATNLRCLPTTLSCDPPVACDSTPILAYFVEHVAEKTVWTQCMSRVRRSCFYPCSAFIGDEVPFPM